VTCIITQSFDLYITSWITFKLQCELKARNKCKLNNDAYRKLKQYHLEQYLTTVEAPFGFLATLKFRYPKLYKQIPCANKYFSIYLSKHQETFHETFNVINDRFTNSTSIYN
jgi:hypothetical protein